MPVRHKSLSHRFHTFSKSQQLLMVCNELNRAESQRKHPGYYKKHIELALELMDFLIDDYAKWEYSYKELLRAREVMAEYYIAQPKSTRSLVDNLIKLCPEAYRMLSRKE